MPKHTSGGSAAPMRVVIVTLDNHLASAAERAQETLSKELPGIEIKLHAAATFSSDASALERCTADIARGDIIISSMLFMDDHIQAVLPALEARREHCRGRQLTRYHLLNLFRLRKQQIDLGSFIGFRESKDDSVIRPNHIDIISGLMT